LTTDYSRRSPSIDNCFDLELQLDVQLVYRQIASLDVSRVFKTCGPIPGIRSFSGHQQMWSQPGQQRRLLLADDSSVTETLIALKKDCYLAFKVSEFSGLFGLLLQYAVGEWRFHTTTHHTVLSWRYRFVPKSPWAKPVLMMINHLFWRRYMQAALSRINSESNKIAQLKGQQSPQSI